MFLLCVMFLFFFNSSYSFSFYPSFCLSTSLSFRFILSFFQILLPDHSSSLSLFLFLSLWVSFSCFCPFLASVLFFYFVQPFSFSSSSFCFISPSLSLVFHILSHIKMPFFQPRAAKGTLIWRSSECFGDTLVKKLDAVFKGVTKVIPYEKLEKDDWANFRFSNSY